MPPISFTIAFPSLLQPDGSGNAPTRVGRARIASMQSPIAPNVSLFESTGAPLLAKTRLSAFAHKMIPSYNFAAAASISSLGARAMPNSDSVSLRTSLLNLRTVGVSGSSGAMYSHPWNARLVAVACDASMDGSTPVRVRLAAKTEAEERQKIRRRTPRVCRP